MHENDFLAKQLIEWTIQVKENRRTKAINSCYPYIYRRYEYLMSTEVMASKKAEELVSDLFVGAHDIRNYDWSKCLVLKSNKKKVNLRSYIHWEHFDTAYEFKNYLFSLYDEDKLTQQNVVDRLFRLRMCWVTKEENNELSKLGYYKERSNPEQAYSEAKIIYS